jgi:putative restriction endonuclease
MVWNIFRESNGSPSLDAFLLKMSQLRNEPINVVGRVGCVVLSDPIYFESPVEYRRMYGPIFTENTATEYGAELWARLATQLVGIMKGASPFVVPTAALGAPTIKRPRLGQGAFRVNVTAAYEGRCAITGERTLPALEAAHIRPFSVEQSHDTRNGLLLRSDIHNLFDQGYVSVRPDFKFVVSKAIREEFENGRDYYRFHETPLRLPGRPEEMPDRDALDWHMSTIFRGV